jgi:hypothetical protein
MNAPTNSSLRANLRRALRAELRRAFIRLPSLRKSAKMRGMRFCLLHHTGWPGRLDHYDLMLQIADGIDDRDHVLKTFSILQNELPDGLRGGSLVVPCPDHKRLYLDYEGPVSGGRGSVTRIDSGGLEFVKKSEKNIEEMHFRLDGKILNGYYVMQFSKKHEPCAFRKCSHSEK